MPLNPIDDQYNKQALINNRKLSNSIIPEAFQVLFSLLSYLEHAK